MYLGIIGHEAAKFTLDGERQAKEIIRRLFGAPGIGLVSGGCHLGGVDIWAEEEAIRLHLPLRIHLPKNLSWIGGYKPRNLLIARDSDQVHVIVVTALPLGFSGMRFPTCYHCGTDAHVKSGGCWTAKQAQAMGKPAFWHEVVQGG